MSYNKTLKRFVYPCCSAHRICKDGSVYILRKDNIYKIGYTSSNHGAESAVKGRYSSFKNNEFHIYHSIYTVCAYGLEKYLHKIFENKRIKNELFELSKSDVEFIFEIKTHANSPVIHKSYHNPAPPLAVDI